MRVAICDDDKNDREKLHRILDEYSRESGREIIIEEYGSDFFPNAENYSRSFTFSFVEGETHLRAADIIYVETNRHKNLFVTENGVYNLYKKLDEIEEQLYPFGFIRAHQSFLVNMRYVERIRSYVLYLKNGMEISVPKSRYSYVKERIMIFLKEQGGENRQPDKKV